VTYGILGLGSIGTRHARNLVSLDYDVIGFDPSPDAHARGITQTQSRTEVLEKSNAVIICSPNAHHLDDLCDAITAGCHVFIEKPLAHTTVGVKQLLDDAAARGLTIFAGLNLRFHPAVGAAKSLIEDGALGNPLWAAFQSSHWLPDWRPGQDYRQGYTADPKTGGVLFDIIHEFDLANHLLGPAETLFATARNTSILDIPSEDCADVVLGHQSGIRSVLHLDYVTRPPRRTVEIGGEKGILRLDLIKRETVLTDNDNNQRHHKTFSETSSADDYVDEMKAFVECVNGKASPPSDGYEALAVLEQVIAARKQCGLPEA